MNHNNYYGLNAENYFLSEMNKFGLKTSYDDTWYDFMVNNKKVEVKSCALFVQNKKLEKSQQVATKLNKSSQAKTKGKKIHYRSGRFHFTEEKNRVLQFKENVWVCFIVRHNEEYMILGFTKAKNLKKKSEITLSQLGKYKLVKMDRWLIEINRKPVKRKKPAKIKISGSYKKRTPPKRWKI